LQLCRSHGAHPLAALGPHPEPSGGGPLMYDVAALLIFFACFVFVFVLIEVFDRV
jgi:hypothetical protein